MKRFITIALFAICLLQAPLAQAYTVAFGDTVNHWDGYGNYNWDKVDGHYVRQNDLDVIGTPDLTGGNFLYDGHTLTGIQLNYTSTSRELVPGDWFFDLNQDGIWDYVLHHTLRVYWDGNISREEFGYGLFAVQLAYGDGQMAGYQSSFWPDGYEGRHDHPVRAWVDLRKELQDVGYDGWDYYGVSEDNPGQTNWFDFELDFTGLRSFTYGFAMTCGNDVLFGESIVPAPEPSTFLLLGFGGLGLLLYGRRRKRSL